MSHSIKRFPLIFYALLILFVTKAIGQPSYNLPGIINPSPQSQSFTRYGDYPMTDYTGLTDITIPLHTINGRKLSLPITMSFHASGRMANEPNGTLGMRWTLNCGGLVTRTMKGSPDEWNLLTPFTVNPTAYTPTFDDLYSACPNGKISRALGKPYYDTEFDIFNYSLPNGKHGHFILKNVDGEKVPMFIPLESLKIEFVKAPTVDYGYYERIDITDVDGTKYIYGKMDASTADAVETTPDYDQQLGMFGNVSTAWYLTKIVSSDGSDEISISYIARYNNTNYATQSATVYDRGRNDNSDFWEGDDVDSYKQYLRDLLYTYHFNQTDVNVMSGQYPTVPIVSAIQFQGGSVTFNYSSVNYFDRLLTEMVVNKESVPYKKVRFNTSKHTNESDLYYLDNLSFYGEDQNLVNEKYNFSYYETGSFYGAFSHDEALAYKDWWGYFGPGHILLPKENINIIPFGSSVNTVTRDVGFDDAEVNRGGDENYKKIGMLKTIDYPTGGQTEFVYEGNQYADGSNYQPPQNSATLEGPGLRIKEVISRPVNGGEEIHKVYKYGVYEDGRGYINELVRPGSISRKNLSMAEGNAMHFWTWQYATDPPQFGGDLQTGYRTRDYFCDPYISFDLSGTLLKYDAVSEYVIEDGIPQQKAQTRYAWGDNEQTGDYIVTDHEYPNFNTRKFFDPQYAWLTPVLNSKSVFKYTNGQFDLIRNETYSYTGGFSYLYEAWDMPTYMHTTVAYSRPGNAAGTVDETGWYNTAKDYHNYNCSIYGYGYRKYTTGKQQMNQSVIEEYTPNGVIRTEMSFDYDNTTYLLRSQELVNSKNELTKTTYSYPFDFPNVPVYQQMVEKNIISPVIENTITVNGTQTKKTITNYYNPSSDVFVPQSIEYKTGNNPQQVVANFNRYDNMGHILEQQKANNVKEVYLWGYQSRYPVAKMLNTTYDAAITYVSQSVLDATTGDGDDATFRSYLNNLRENLPGALVETYTYKPLVGMTSATDANGRTTYYEYDGFGRLAYIRDKDNNILKKYAYDYQGQCTTCGPMSGANWQATGNTRAKPCEVNNAYNSTYGQREEKDVNPSSPTYGTTRWVDYSISSGDPLYDASVYTEYEQYWVNTSTPPRCIQVSGQNTGEQEQEQVYIAPNPCNIHQNSIRWKNLGTNTNACPLPSAFTSDDLSGNYYSSVCTVPAEPDAIYVSVPAGMFTSTVSVADANEQARQYAQTYADTHGSCTVPPVTVTFINNYGGGFTVTLTDINTGQNYNLYSVNGSDVSLQNVPQATYSIYMSPSYYQDWIHYEVGCNYFIETQGDVWVDEIVISSSCNTITAY